MAQGLGIVSLTMSGFGLMDTLGGAQLEPGGLTRTSLETDHDVHYIEKRTKSAITVKIAKTSSTPKLTEIKRWKGEATYEMDDGSVVTLPKAWVVGEVKLVPGEGGGIDFVIDGKPADEE